MSPLRRGARARYGRLSDFPLHRVAHGGGRAEAERVRGAARVLAAERVRGAPRVLARLAPGRGGRVDVRLGVEARGRVGRVGRVGDGEHVLEVVGFRLEHLRRPLDGRRRAPRKEHPGGAMPSSGVRRVSRKRSSAHSRGLLSSAASRRPRADAAARRGARAAHLDELQREVEVGEPPRHVGERLPVLERRARLPRVDAGPGPGLAQLQELVELRLGAPTKTRASRAAVAARRRTNPLGLASTRVEKGSCFAARTRRRASPEIRPSSAAAARPRAPRGRGRTQRTAGTRSRRRSPAFFD
mmetsp:Transcript_19778/g.58867  ORF Transcript_19778/g.58867 Transcript_19778/m.58867 type:complete len:299 (-) Transcript_19778:266-1162(-)